MIEKRKIADLDASAICLGTMTFGNPVSWDQSAYLVHWALDHGINFFDTADIYEGYDRQFDSAGGRAERILGEALRDRRDDAIITTKVGNSIGDDHYRGTGLGAAHIRHQIDASLHRMQTDYVDVYEFHKPDPNTPLEESIGVMADLIGRGKVRYWGFSNFDGAAIHRVLDLCEVNNWPKPVLNQPRYSWLVRDVENDQTPICVEHEIAITPYRGLECGLLTGKYQHGKPLPEDSRLNEKSEWVHALSNDSVIADDLFDAIDQFLREADLASMKPAAYAVRWLLDRPGVKSVILGVKRLEQLKHLLADFDTANQHHIRKVHAQLN